jgi:hypothetical protein
VIKSEIVAHLMEPAMCWFSVKWRIGALR